MGTIVAIGASSAISIELVNILKANGQTVIGISRNGNFSNQYDQFYSIENILEGNFPTIEGPIDGMVYFPGSINLKPFKGIKISDITNDFEVNVLGAVRAVQQILPNLLLSNNASVVFISSVAASIGLPFHTSVSISKSALEGLMRSLASEYAGKIRFNTIAPSLTDTPLASKFLNTPEKKEAAAARNPMKKVGTPSEIAQSIFFLLSQNSSWVTGQVLAVDGGMVNLK